MGQRNDGNCSDPQRTSHHVLLVFFSLRFAPQSMRCELNQFYLLPRHRLSPSHDHDISSCLRSEGLSEHHSPIGHGLVPRSRRLIRSRLDTDASLLD